MINTVKRVFVWVLVAVGLFGVLIGVEVFMATRREYLPTEPALEIGGVFGKKGPVKELVVLGDSTGAGVGAESASGAYATVMAERLAAETGSRIRLTGLAVSGARVADVLKEQVPLALAEEADVYLVAIGANDVTHLTKISEVRDGIARIVGRLSGDGSEVVVAGAPDMRAPAFAEPLRSIVGWRGRAVTAATEEAARAGGATVVPLAERTREFFLEDPDAHYSPDLFHPSAGGYARWADALYPEVKEALASS
ncbi:MAG: SGNH/GDSL hydrolase family protein [Actinomycetota bacterium]|nr:SGNH/GDSL hydrolase family protein [Actinomycetota bacterium]